MTRQRIGYGWGLVALALTAATAQAAITVLQVESYDTATPKYAPVNFAGSTTKTVSGVTYNALSEVGSVSSSTLSNHAFVVRDAMIGADRPSAGLVTSIYNQNVTDYFNGLAVGTSSRPAAFPTGVKVANFSLVTKYVSAANNEDARRRIDYQIHRGDVVYVTGADTFDTNYYSLPWASLNGIAVSGYSNFNPVAAGLTRVHADLWAKTTSTVNASVGPGPSYTAATVSGFAVALLDRGQTLSFTDSQQHTAIKSLLMTGANRSISGAAIGGTTWTANSTSNNNLDTFLGAGQADYNRSKLILEAGERTTSAITGGTSLGSSPTINNKKLGWTYHTLNTNTSEALVFNLGSAVNDFSATLNWDTTVAELSGNRINTSSQTFANLDLELRQVFFNSGSYSLGGSLGGTLVSASTTDNTEHLYYNGILWAGYYALVVKSNLGDPATTDYALSYIAIPEPGTLGLLFLGSAGLLMRRRRQSGKS
ncbi:MAG: PEP-CTERM sorting domain-containing protein [Phycisphaerae bacterium]